MHCSACAHKQWLYLKKRKISSWRTIKYFFTFFGNLDFEFLNEKSLKFWISLARNKNRKIKKKKYVSECRTAKHRIETASIRDTRFETLDRDVLCTRWWSISNYLNPINDDLLSKMSRENKHWYFHWRTIPRFYIFSNYKSDIILLIEKKSKCLLLIRFLWLRPFLVQRKTTKLIRNR